MVEEKLPNPPQELPKPPPGWGQDPLSEFFDVARRNLFATFDTLRPEYMRLSEIDRAFRSFLDKLDNTPEVVPTFLLLRAHAAYLAAVRLGVAGETVESYMVQRGCIEAALYALFMANHPERQRIWRERDQGEPQRKRARNTFKPKPMLDAVREKAPRVHRAAAELYEWTIEQGAHPNPGAIFSNLKIQKTESHYLFDLAYLVPDGTVLRSCLRATMQVGICALNIFGVIFPDRFRTAGLAADMANLSRGL